VSEPSLLLPYPPPPPPPPPSPPPLPLPLLLPLPSSSPLLDSIDDDAWADKIDPVTGSVFYLDAHPAPPPHREESPQPQSSSSSSMSSISDIVPHSLPTHLLHGSPSLSDRSISANAYIMYSM